MTQQLTDWYLVQLLEHKRRMEEKERNKRRMEDYRCKRFGLSAVRRAGL